MAENRFSGKRALVTGAGKGIGKAVAKALAAQGAEVFALSRTKSHVDALVEEDPRITGICIDLSDVEATKAEIAKVCPIHLLVNNAGISVLKSFLETDVESFDRIMAVNVRAYMVVAQVVAKALIDKGIGGSIVNISSQLSQRAAPDHTSYCVSKGAVDQLTRVMALELGPHKIRVNSIHPTVVLTEMGKKAWSEPEKSAWMRSKIPLNRFAEVEEIVGPVLFLLSDESSMVHGTLFPVNGGAWVV